MRIGAQRYERCKYNRKQTQPQRPRHLSKRHEHKIDIKAGFTSVVNNVSTNLVVLRHTYTNAQKDRLLRGGQTESNL